MRFQAVAQLAVLAAPDAAAANVGVVADALTRNRNVVVVFVAETTVGANDAVKFTL